MLFKTLYCPSCDDYFPREEPDEMQFFYMCHECRSRRARDRHEQSETWKASAQVAQEQARLLAEVVKRKVEPMSSTVYRASKGVGDVRHLRSQVLRRPK